MYSQWCCHRLVPGFGKEVTEFITSHCPSRILSAEIVTDLSPSHLQGCKTPSVQRLGNMCGVRRQSEDEDAVFSSQLYCLRTIMGRMSIKQEQQGTGWWYIL